MPVDATWDPVMQTFRRTFGDEPSILAQAPGRINLIGEHTDYNDGLVLPAAIARGVRVAARPGSGGRVRLHAAAFAAGAHFPADDPGQPALPAWAKYPAGVARLLLDRGLRVPAVDAVIGGDLPMEAGLSSSAALEVASALVFEAAGGTRLAARERALLCHAAEVEFVGVPCGVMDQFAVCLARAGHALLLDCRRLEVRHVPIDPALVIAVCDTGVRRALASSAYADRRRECAEAVAALKMAGVAVAALSDLTSDDLPALDRLPEPLRRRARHVVTENTRVRQTVQLLEAGDRDGLREIFWASHRSLRDDYEVSSPELDAMVEAALAAPGCLAARMTGAGFGGAVVALVAAEARDEFLAAAAQGYRQRTGRIGACFATSPADGAQIVT